MTWWFWSAGWLELSCNTPRCIVNEAAKLVREVYCNILWCIVTQQVLGSRLGVNCIAIEELYCNLGGWRTRSRYN